MDEDKQEKYEISSNKLFLSFLCFIAIMIISNLKINIGSEVYNLSNEDGWIKCVHVGVLLVLCTFEVAILIKEFDKYNYINNLIMTDKYILCDFWEEITCRKLLFSRVKHYIICHYNTENGKKYEFRSEAFFDEDNFFKDGDYIKVYIDTDSTDDRYFVSPKMIRVTGIRGR